MHASLIRFVNCPTQLLTAHISFDDSWREEAWEDLNARQKAKFLQGLLCVRNLQVRGTMKLFLYLDLVVDGAMPVFHNLTSLKTNLKCGSDGWDDLLLSLECAPNLEDIDVTVEGYPGEDPRNFCIPGCLLDKIKTLRILGLRGDCYDSYELELMEYILKNASVLEQLRLETRTKVAAKDKGVQVGREYNLCEAAFKLPRSSPTSEVVFSGIYIKATSNAMKDGLLDGQIRFLMLQHTIIHICNFLELESQHLPALQHMCVICGN